MKYYFSKTVTESVRQIRAATDRRIANGETASAEMYNEELRQWESRPETRSLLPPYYRAQICYAVLLQSEIDGNPVTDYSVPVGILAEWGKAIARDGLAANVTIPDDAAMRKILSRPVRFTPHGWEQQGHIHQTDGLSLPERIESVRQQIHESGE